MKEQCFVLDSDMVHVHDESFRCVEKSSFSIIALKPYLMRFAETGPGQCDAQIWRVAREPTVALLNLDGLQRNIELVEGLVSICSNIDEFNELISQNLWLCGPPQYGGQSRYFSLQIVPLTHPASATEGLVESEQHINKSIVEKVLRAYCVLCKKENYVVREGLAKAITAMLKMEHKQLREIFDKHSNEDELVTLVGLRE